MKAKAKQRQEATKALLWYKMLFFCLSRAFVTCEVCRSGWFCPDSLTVGGSHTERYSAQIDNCNKAPLYRNVSLKAPNLVGSTAQQ